MMNLLRKARMDMWNYSLEITTKKHACTQNRYNGPLSRTTRPEETFFFLMGVNEEEGFALTTRSIA